ncbi:hypothetical protein C8Q73DRAFT_443774 [Cubamyces lactineus]|nr:hypothetical protein C8Q73DRAFT_443774 [Cubamyces lactineus]
MCELAGMVMSSSNLPEAIQQAKRREVHGVFVAEAKSPEQILSDHIPQVVTEMIVCAERMGSRYIRGTVTSGREWIFLLLELNADQEGGQYWRSEVHSVSVAASPKRLTRSTRMSGQASAQSSTYQSCPRCTYSTLSDTAEAMMKELASWSVRARMLCVCVRSGH